jgi:azobenzene reductase
LFFVYHILCLILSLLKLYYCTGPDLVFSLIPVPSDAADICDTQTITSMKVAILLGSVRRGRNSHRAAYYIRKLLDERNIESDLIDLAENPLPVFEDMAGYSTQLDETIKDISTRLHEAEAIIFVTPEYHGSFSGVLKNAVDYFWSEFQKKPIGVVATSAGRMAGINASTQLQHVILSLGAYPLPLKLLIPEIQKAFDDSFNPLINSIANSARKFLDEFLWLAEAITNQKKEKVQLS